MTWKQIRKKLSKKIEVNEIEIYLLFKLKVVTCVQCPPFKNCPKSFCFIVFIYANSK